MLDFSRLEQYRENNRIEAKKALGGLPKSIWETYSAFANTLGGIILLGVIETADKTFDSVDLPDPDGLIREFWHIINDPMKVSVNILAEKDVYAEEVGGDHIVVIKVPRADRAYKPVYVDNDTRNTYRRSGEGDYRCTYEEYQAMVRDAAVRSPDMHLVRSMGLEALNSESVRSFRQRMKLYRPRHMWESLDDTAFLQKIDAIGDDGGLLHPTFAGLLMFGNHQDILCEYPNYAITYRKQLDTKGNWEEAPWSGNVYEFYYWAYNKLQQNAKKPARQALREVLANCLVNADYHGSGGIIVSKGYQKITLSNPGSFRVPLVQVLVLHCNKEGECFPSIKTIAAKCGYGVSTVKRALDELVKAGYIVKQARFDERKNGGQTSNLYTLCSDLLCPDEPENAPVLEDDASDESPAVQPESAPADACNASDPTPGEQSATLPTADSYSFADGFETKIGRQFCRPIRMWTGGQSIFIPP